jgi:C4-dicarboxylate-specific signal transduction histidine kinase
MEPINTRVLIIDDEETIRDSIESILIPYRPKKSEKLLSAASILFDDDEVNQSDHFTNNSNIPVFVVDKAINGMDGVEKIKKAVEENSPYAVIFLDMRMPGWDGLETALHIREVDSKAEIIIVTAFSDRSIEEIIDQIGQNVGYHCKPYAAEEILQLATKAVNDYNKLRNLEKLITLISSINLSQTHLNSLLQNILDQLAMYIGSDTALLGKMMDNNEYKKLFYIGPNEKDINIVKISEIIASAKYNREEVEQIDEVVFVKLDGYSIFAVVNKDIKLKTEKLYLLRLFVQNAAKAIKNMQLNEELLQKEKLSAIGNALGMLMHDLRTPIKSIPMLTAMMREDGGDSELLDMIDKCGEQANEIFDDFLDFLKDAPLVLLPVSVDQLIIDCKQATNNIAKEKNIKFTSIEETNLTVSGDVTKLRRVIINLINNALDALSGHKVQNAIIDIQAKKVEKDIVITIKDNGPGIPIKIIDNLFEAFVTTGKSNGTGLGLAIVKQFIVAHYGSITVKNNDGAEFTITLPAAK